MTAAADPGLSESGLERRLHRGRLAWAAFDCGQHAYWLLVATFIFTPYFTTGVVGNAAKGQALMGYAGDGWPCSASRS